MVTTVKPRAKSKEPAVCSVELSTDLNIRSIPDAHAQLSEALKSGAPIVVTVPPEATVDLTFVQLMEAARRSNGDRGGQFSLSRPAEGGLLETLRRGGFLEAADSRRFWLMDAGV
ncbi:STAS domain-containing protein [Phenylobacterium aquaticum]|uniref:STAS domain-containing protein n=1 Tax=Phenylobacterium aquaticum TaxID=1763816 RepID=UPI001F5E06F4|nr:STAS domain-containing protein [Phenylobacterium aquaticum]